MRVKVDEDLPTAVLDLVRQSGADVRSVREQGMGGWKDPDLWPAVQQEHRLLITGDKGFADIRRYPPGTHSGVVLLRPDEDGIRPLATWMRSLLDFGSLAIFEGALVVVKPRAIRVRSAR